MLVKAHDNNDDVIHIMLLYCFLFPRPF